MQRGIQVMLIDRSNPDQIVAIDPKRPVNERRISQLQDLRERPFGHRSDIVLVNIWVGGECKEQLCAYPTRSGEPQGRALEYLHSDELAEARAINARIIATAKQHPEFEKFLGRA